PGFYYDYPSDTCRPFRYGSCHGPVPFTSRDLCDQTCVARGK
ncbi:MAG: proteinase inhibitor I4 serpin, partial [Chromatiaceae bacterium]|nr:proteinase inhibitor I4 serpin [Chromatiaceae bacterium]MBP6735472.1 proteinase inhibitor I4 serpin [Chromatiaceae bacterium]MBP8289779.1 proteinase inhibitor I4 serpin [Chromatiaceae bacterium]